MMPAAAQQEAPARWGEPRRGSAQGSPGAPDVVVCDELALLIAAARDAAWRSHCNLVGVPYQARREALARLRGALAGYDQARGAL